MLEKWVRASRSAQTRYNRICHIWSAKPRNFHFEKSKMYSQERKLLRAICDAYPDSEIAVSFSNLCNKDRDDRKFEIDIFCHDTEINGKVYASCRYHCGYSTSVLRPIRLFYSARDI